MRLISLEERESIIKEAIERALLMLPEVMENQMAQNMKYLELNKNFYDNHKEFSEHKDIVTSVIEKIDGDNPGMEYEEILKLATPEITNRLETMSKLDFKTLEEPELNGEL